MNKNCIFFLLLFIFPFLVYSKSFDERFDYLEEEVRECSILDKQYSSMLIEEMYSIAAQSSDSISYMARTLYAETGLDQRQAIGDSTLITRIENLLQNQNISKHDEILLQYAIGNLLLTSEDYAGAFDITFQILEKAEQLNDSLLVARILNTLGVISNNVSLRQMGTDYYEKAMEWSAPYPGDYTYYLIRINLLTTQLFEQSIYSSQSEDVAPIMDSIQSLMNVLETEKRDGLLLMLLLNSSNYWSATGDKEKTFDYLTKAQNLCRDNSHIESLIDNNLGIYYLYEVEDYPMAMECFQKARTTLEQNNISLFLATIYSNISTTYEKMNQLDSSLYYLKKNVKISESNIENSHIVETHRKYISASLEASESKLALAHSEIVMKTRQFIIILISSIAFVIIAILVFIIFGQKQKSMKQTVLLKDVESKELTARLEKEKSLKELQEKQLEDKLREITSYSLHLSSKNQVMEQIINIMDEFPNTDKTLKKKVKSIVKENIQIDNDWDDFLLHFNEVHPHFFEKLYEIHPEISQNEVRLAAYIRLGLSIKQIAQMLNITPESVKTSRYRLRKKMNLSKEDVLDTVIQSL